VSKDRFEGTFGSGRGRPVDPSAADQPACAGLLDVLAAELFAGLDASLLVERAEELGATVRQERMLLCNPMQSQSWELQHPDPDRPALLIADWDLSEDPPGFDEEAGDEWQPTVRQVQCFVFDRRAYMGRAVESVARLIAEEKKRVQSQPVFEQVVTLHDFGGERAGRPQVTTDRIGPYKARWGYQGWTKSMYEQEWFDSSTEREMVNLLDTTDSIAFWARLQTGDLPILWSSAGQQYNPDLIAVEKAGDHWLVEVKADKE
jgi:hypothetical protein